MAQWDLFVETFVFTDVAASRPPAMQKGPDRSGRFCLVFT
jgi:hypothetical protein